MTINYIYFGEDFEECLRVENILRVSLPESEFYILRTDHDGVGSKHHYVRICFKNKSCRDREIYWTRMLDCIENLVMIDTPVELNEMIGNEGRCFWWAIKKDS